MAQFYLVRHGQASINSINYDQLSELGIQQSHWLGQHFKQCEVAFDAVITGDLVRQQDTAAILQQNLGTQLPVDRKPGLNEFSFRQMLAGFASAFPQQTFSPAHGWDAFYGTVKNAIWAWQRGDISAEGLESWADFQQRVQQAFAEIREQYCDYNNVLIVSSAGVISYFVHQLLQTPKEVMVELNMVMLTSGYSHGLLSENNYTLTSFNQAPHLEPVERAHAKVHT